MMLRRQKRLLRFKARSFLSIITQEALIYVTRAITSCLRLIRSRISTMRTVRIQII